MRYTNQKTNVFVYSAIAVVSLSLMPAYGQSIAESESPLKTLMDWMPFILQGFALNLLMSVVAMFLATVSGVILGFMQLSPVALVRYPSVLITQILRNSPWIAILFAMMLLIPYRFTLPGGLQITSSDWIKATIAFALPVAANVAEILRGAVLSIPSGQWESAESLAFTRRQTLRYVILPQCIRMMLPPWMNWYALLTLTTPMAAIIGVNEALGNTQAAMEAAGSRPELLIPFYVFLLIIFFLFIYPISIVTRRLETRFATGS